MSGVHYSTIRDREAGEREAKMTVILKEDVYRTADGKPVAHGDPNARFLVGRSGKRIADRQAADLGLVDGWLPSSKEGAPDRQDKERRIREDKSGRRPPPIMGRPLSQPDPGETRGPSGPSAQTVGSIIRDMVAEAAESDEARARLFTTDGRPDSVVMSTRLGKRVTAAERDEAWAAFDQKEPKPTPAPEPEADADTDDAVDPI